MARILINATTCVVGGGIQVTVSLLGNLASGRGRHEYLALVSAPVLQSLQSLGVDCPFPIHCLRPTPARIGQGAPTRERIRRWERDFEPDAVFTVFGPAYVRFQAPHLLGFANPFVTHPVPLSFRNHSFLERTLAKLKARYRLWHLRTATEIVVETETARQGLLRKLGWRAERIHVLPNSYSAVLEDYFKTHALRQFDVRQPQVRVLVLAAPYPHKNLQFVPEVASVMGKVDSGKTYTFLLTVPPEGKIGQAVLAKARALGVEKSVINLGPIPQHGIGDLYNSIDVVLHPTLLETFSATYPEAMVMRRPIVTSDFPFLREICGAAAYYYNPIDALDCARQIRELAHSPEQYHALVKKGLDQLKTLPTADQKFGLQLALLDDFCRRNCPASKPGPTLGEGIRT